MRNNYCDRDIFDSERNVGRAFTACHGSREANWFISNVSLDVSCKQFTNHEIENKAHNYIFY